MCNFIPLLFLTFQAGYGIPLTKITMLAAINFGVQLLTDLLAAGFADKIGYRICMVGAHVLAAAGLAALTVLPQLFTDPFTGLLLAVILYALGGGLLEVLVSPVMESCPTDNKEKAMSLLHSFSCWGHAAVVLLSTLFFRTFGIHNWKILALIWAAVPVFNALLFTKAPIAPLNQEGKGVSVRELCARKAFWVFVVMMVCAGAGEQSLSQWASSFAEKSLGLSKTVGDLAGPMSFAVFMGAARVMYGKWGDKINLDLFMTISTVLCLVSYLCIALIPVPALGLAGCALCGFSVGIMWPGTLSKAAAGIKGGGTAMFALLALAGDLGCSVGPALAGMVSGQFGGSLKAGILSAAIFPAVLLFSIRRKH